MLRVDIVVVGAGQTGLVTSHHLRQQGTDHVVLGRGGVADSWRNRRRDSLALNAPNWIFRLPGYAQLGLDPHCQELGSTSYRRHSPGRPFSA